MDDFIDEFDQGDEGVAKATPTLQLLQKKIEESVELQKAADQMEDDLKALKRQIHVLRTNVLPDMMAEIGVDSLSWQGWTVKVDDFVSGSLPSDPAKRAVAVKWLEDHGAGGLLKTKMSLDFAKSQHNEALDLAERLRNEGHAPEVVSSVHPQTLQAFARERLRSGEEIDSDALGLFVGRVAKFKEAKK